MRDGQQSSRSSGGPEFDNGKKQQWVPRKDCVSGDQVLGGDGIQENGQYNIACDDSKQQNGLHSIFNGNDATNKEEKSPYQRDAMEPVAIIGFSLRFPQDATSPQGFWDMLYQGTSAKTEVPSDRFNIKAFYHPDSSRISSINFKDGHFVKNLAAFDAPFFSITPTEAASMDPQQRGLLEITYRALENAGITLDTASGSKTSVHVGCFTREYDHMSYRDPELQPKYQASGSGFALLANRLSWYYNLTGPSMVIDSACSSSLNALHLGCESLRRGESDMGIVAGCNLFFNPDMSTPLTNLNFLSPDGRCYSFDHRANGYARGEGIGVVIIKRLSDALRDGDTIRAVIRASGANQDGRTPGITQPSQTAQEDLIQATYKAGGLNFHTTRYFEAHGTGTAIGDPIEAGAIGTIFGPQRSSDDPLFIGAVKSNIGHLEGASGIAGVLKTILVLEKGIIPPNIGFEYPNPKILVDDWNIKFPVKPTLWPSSGLRRASVNSFGYGGANCHIVLDDAFNYLRLRQIEGKHNTTKSPLLEMSPDRGSEISKEYRHQCHPELLPKSASSIVATNGFMDSTPSDDIEVTTIESVLPDNLNGKNRNKHPQLLVWSASDESGLRRLATAYSQHDFAAYRLENSACFGALAQTLASGRAQLPWKSFSIAESINDMQTRLDESMSKPIRSNEAPLLGFVFSGQGAAWHGMGRELLAYTDFKRSLQASEEYLQSLGSSVAILDSLQSKTGHTHLESALVSQSLSTATQLALVDLLRSWEIYPSIVIGHSSGEIAAAYSIGAISKHSALRIAYYRGALADNLSSGSQGRGAMLAVALSEAEVEPYLRAFGCDAKHQDLTIGCINSPKNVTLTGGARSVQAFEILMKKEKIFAKELNVNVAYHSKFMQEIVAEYSRLIDNIVPDTDRKHESGHATMISTVSAKEVSPGQLRQSQYWIDNLVSPVRFSEALVEVCTRSVELESSQGWNGPGPKAGQIRLLIEIGPHSAMQKSVKDVLGMLGKSNHIGYSSVLYRDLSATRTAMQMAGDLYCRGYQLAINKINTFGAKISDGNTLVDLPEYPFNHSREYWQESRLSTNFRFREHPRHELLGTTVLDWNKLEGKWRNYIRISESPWIKDHKVNDSQLYPAAGMLVMAIEASRQLADKTRKLRGYRIKETNFHKAMVIPSNEDGLETNFFLRPHKATNGQQCEWSDFRLCSYANGEWVDNCSGIVGLQYDETYDEVDDGREECEGLATSEQSFKAQVDRCKRPVKPEKLYSILRLSGYNFGPTFQVLHEIFCNDENEATALLDPLSWRQKLPNLAVQNHIIHPTCLDGVLQTTSIILTKGGRRHVSTTYPTRIDDLWISGDLCSDVKCPILRVAGKSVVERLREVETSIVAMDLLEELRIVINGFRATALANLNSASTDNSEQRRLCFNLDWKPDLDLMDNDQVTRYCNSAINLDTQNDAMIQQNKDLELTCALFMAKTLTNVTSEDLVTFMPHIQKYYQWMEQKLTEYGTEESASGQSGWRSLVEDQICTENLFDRIEHLNPVGKLIVTVGRQHIGILRGQVDVMELLFSSDLATDFYRYLAEQDPNYRKLAVYLDALAHKNPGLRILEIGAGTGGTTAPALDALSQQGQNNGRSARYSQYTFTDISSGFFEKAKTRFAEHGERIDFRTLNIEKDPLQQGFEAESYDLIIAANVLHATSDLGVTLRNTRKLLTPNGKLILFEVCNPSLLRVPFPFGMLSGWWLSSEKDRQDGPLMEEAGWHGALSTSGYTGADVILRDHEDQVSHNVSMIISTASENVSSGMSPAGIAIVASVKSSIQSQVAERLKAYFAFTMPLVACVVIDPEGFIRSGFEQTFCVFLPELDRPFLLELDSDKLMGLQKIVVSASGILWVTQAGIAAMNPDFALVEGLSRTVRSENGNLKFVTLAVENPQEIAGIVVAIVKTTSEIFQMEEGPLESEYLENEGLLQISRLVEDHDMNEELFTATGSPKSQLMPFGNLPDRALKLEIPIPGILETLRFVDDPAPKQDLPADEIEVRVHACGVNFSDVLIVLGQVGGDNLGTECSGIVERVGHSVTNIKPGARVCCIAYGAFRTYVRVKIDLLVEIPDDISLAAAAGIPTIYCTAYHALFNVARMTKGETILIHSAAGGVGQAAIQLSKILGAEIYATVGTKTKKALIMELYGIHEDHIFSSRNKSFAQGVQRMTKNRGVDVILNSIAGWGLRESWDCIGNFGRFVEIGKSDIYSHASLPMWPFSKCATFASGDLTIMAKDKPSLLGSILRAVIDLFRAGKITSPRPEHIYRGGGLLDAFRYLQSGKNTGKTIIELHEGDLVPVIPTLPTRYNFEPDATYVIAGASGGLGRCIARWMGGRGARNLILLSRSGMTSEAAMALMAELLEQKINAVALSCDVSKAEVLSRALKECESMPPVKGCIQASLALKDAIFENLSLEDFKSVLAPKVQGSYNLHTQLPNGMDFFILLSSVAGVTGNRGQSNYACGNTYQDALARYRNSIGEKAVAIDLSIVGSVGFIAERLGTEAAIQTSPEYMTIEENQFYAVLEHYCNPALGILSPRKSQLVMGIHTPAELASRGHDAPVWAQTPLFRHISYMDQDKATGSSSSQAAGSSVDVKTLLRQATSSDEREEVVCQALVLRLSKSLSIPPEDIDVNKPMHMFGIDSLVAVEIRHWFGKEMKAEVTVIEVLENRSVAALSSLVAGRSQYV